MVSLEAINILEYTNMGITVLFLSMFLLRIFSLRHLAITDRFGKHKSILTIVLCVLYMVTAFVFFGFAMNSVSTEEQKHQKVWSIQQGVGTVLDGIILGLDVFLLKVQLAKQKPYSRVHLIFCVYLVIISLLRLIFSIIIHLQSATKPLVWIILYSILFTNSLLVLVVWIIKRKQLPQFYNQYFNADQLRSKDLGNLMQRNIDNTLNRSLSDSFHYLYPVVSVEQNKFRIILETPQSPQQKSLKIVSNSIYTLEDVGNLHKLCGRFSMKQKIPVKSGNLAQIYLSLQKYLDQLFQKQSHYLPNILTFFSVPTQYLAMYNQQLASAANRLSNNIYSQIDHNASIISIRIFKHIWMDDHYLFYIDALPTDRSFQSCTMKRYTDFQHLHEQLERKIKKNNYKLNLPSLPKKHLFNLDEQKMFQRRTQLQFYLRCICNDYTLMLQLPQMKDIVGNFLDSKIESIVAKDENACEFLNDLKVVKGDILKYLIQDEYVTFYQFRVMKEEVCVRQIERRYSDFESLHQSLERYRFNTQTYYQYIILPEKHLFKSGSIRHEKLKNYLNLILTIPENWKIYHLLSFLSLDSAQSNSFCPNQNTKGIRLINDEKQIIHSNMYQMKIIPPNQRISYEIDQLGHMNL